MAVDVLNPGLVTDEAPQSRIGGDAIAMASGGRGNNALAQGLGRLAEGVDDLAVSTAKREGEAIAARSVTRNEDGSLNVQPVPYLPAFGRAGDVLENTVAKSTEALGITAMQDGLTALRQKNINDPDAFRKDAGDFIDGIKAKWPGPIGDSLFADGARAAQQHYQSLVNTRYVQTTQNQQQAFETLLTDGSNALSVLSRAGITSGPDWDAAHAKVDNSLRELTANPAFNWSAEKIASTKDLLEQRLHFDAAVGKVDHDYSSVGYLAAQKNLNDTISNAPGSMPPERRAALISAGQQRLEFLRGQNIADVTANQQNVETLTKSALTPGAVVPDAVWQDAIDLATNKLHDPASVARINAARTAYTDSRAGTGLPPAAQIGTAMGSGGGAAPFDPANTDGYLNRVKSIENPSGNPRAVSPTGARGDFQFTKGTAADYGVVDPTNPAQAREGARQLAIDNAASLQKALGRPPTEAETYLAHQQGAAGAAALLLHPELPAVQALATYAYGGDLAKADQAIRVNGGTPGMTADQFAQKWTSRYANAPAPSVNGVAYTPEALAANPFLGSLAVQRLAQDREQQAKIVAQLGTSIEGNLSKHILPAVDDAASYLQLAQGIPSEAPRAQKILAGYQAASQANADFARLGPDASQTYANDVLQKAQGGSIWQAQIASAYKEAIDNKVSQFKNDPFGAAASAGWIQRRPIPLNFNDPQQLAQGMAERAETAGRIGTWTRNLSQSAVPPQEIDQVKSVMTNGTLDQRVATLGAIASPAFSQPVRQATLSALAKDSDTQVLAAAGLVASQQAPGALATAQAIITGDKLVKENPKLWADGKETEPALFKALPQADFPNTEARNGIQAGVKALYAKLSADAGDLSGKLNQDRLKAAVDGVTGGVVGFRGSQVVTPWYGATETQFRAALQSLTPNDLREAVTADGSPFPATALQSRELGTAGNWRLQSVGSGRYLVFSGDDENRRYVQRQVYEPGDAGGAFVLDLGSKRDQVINAPIQPPRRLPPARIAPISDPTFRPTDTLPGKGPLPISVEIGS